MLIFGLCYGIIHNVLYIFYIKLGGNYIMKLNITERERIYSGYLNIDRLKIVLPNNIEIYRMVIQIPDIVAILAVSSTGEVFLTKQPRAGIDLLESIEIPGGLVNPGELPEIAAEEAKKIEGDEADTEAPVDLSSTVSETEETSADDKPLEFVDEEEVSDDETPENEEVVHTQLPYDFFAEDTSLEFVEDDEPEEEPAVTVDEFEADVEAGESDSEPADETEDDESTPADIPITRRFSVDVGRIDYSFDSEADEEGTDEGESESETSDETEYDEEAVDSDVDDDTDDEEEDDEDDNPSPRPNSCSLRSDF